jgi:2-oxoglutarate ferredoxin oxidoreductase subunit alpha
MSSQTLEPQSSKKPVKSLDEVTVRFAGDSGDGMQLAGMQFTRSTVIFGNDISTFPDYPAEIRAPAGSLAGVSGFQVNFSSHEIHTPGDAVHTLVAFNPAALKTNLRDVCEGGIIVVNEDDFGKTDLKKAGYENNPLDDGTLNGYQVYRIPIGKLNATALASSGLGAKDIDRCKNFFALGVISWLYNRPLEPTLGWIDGNFGKKNPVIAEANKTVLKAGYFYGETCELFPSSYQVPKALLPKGRYRRISGNEAVAIGLITAANLAGKDLFYGSYPITPASDILHNLSKYKNFRVKTFQAEDEIAAMTSALGAAFAGDVATTGTSGPGLALKGEAIGLGVMTELPVVIVDVQRGGPSTGLPTKTEQADLLQAVCGRNGECPVCVLAASTPADCFNMAIEAVRIAMRFMVPVILLTDGYIANGEEPWMIPDISKLPKIEVRHPESNGNGHEFMPYQRDERLARPWALPGTKGLEHRIGGLEKQDITGNVNYEPENHEHMVHLRARKVASIANDIPEQTVMGPDSGELLVLGWGGTAGAIRSAVQRVQEQGLSVAGAHLRYMNPFPKNLGAILKRYKKVLVPELNMGQLRMLIRGQFLVDAIGLNKIQGRPFLIAEIEAKIKEVLKG